MKFAERVSSFLKSFGGGSDEEKKKEGEEASKDDINLDNQGGDTSGEGGDGDMEKSEYADATEIMTSLVDELKTLNKSIEAINKRQEGMEKSQTDLGEAVVGVAELVAKIANSPNPVKATMTKSLPGNGSGTAPAAGNGEVLTRVEFEQAQRALVKSFAEKKISLFQSARLESEMQKAMSIAGYQMAPEDRALIASALKTA
jgi:archaellum component FlaC